MKYILILFLVLIASCGEGLEPNHATFPAEQTKIFGTIKFIGTWPPIDSLNDLRVIGIKNFPPKDFLTAFTSGDILFTDDSLEYFKDEVNYEIIIDNPPMTIEYLAVAQNYGELLDWKSVGVYEGNGDPIILNLKKGDLIEANFTVDFDNLPTQPF